jgi:hypothetical protein
VIVAVQHTEEERGFVLCGAVVWWMSGRCGGVVDEWMSLLCGAVACCAVGCVVRRVRRVRWGVVGARGTARGKCPSMGSGAPLHQISVRY